MSTMPLRHQPGRGVPYLSQEISGRAHTPTRTSSRRRQPERAHKPPSPHSLTRSARCITIQSVAQHGAEPAAGDLLACDVLARKEGRGDRARADATIMVSAADHPAPTPRAREAARLIEEALSGLASSRTKGD